VKETKGEGDKTEERRARRRTQEGRQFYSKKYRVLVEIQR